MGVVGKELRCYCYLISPCNVPSVMVTLAPLLIRAFIDCNKMCVLVYQGCVCMCVYCPGHVLLVCLHLC